MGEAENSKRETFLVIKSRPRSLLLSTLSIINGDARFHPLGARMPTHTFHIRHSAVIVRGQVSSGNDYLKTGCFRERLRALQRRTDVSGDKENNFSGTRRGSGLWGELQVYADGRRLPPSGPHNLGSFFFFFFRPSTVKCPSSFGNKGEEIRREI